MRSQMSGRKAGRRKLRIAVHLGGKVLPQVGIDVSDHAIVGARGAGDVERPARRARKVVRSLLLGSRRTIKSLDLRLNRRAVVGMPKMELRVIQICNIILLYIR